MISHDVHAYDFGTPYKAGDQVTFTHTVERRTRGLDGSFLEYISTARQLMRPATGEVIDLVVLIDGVQRGDQFVGEKYMPALVVRTASGSRDTVLPVHVIPAQPVEEITGNPILDAFAARDDTDTIRHWRNAASAISESQNGNGGAYIFNHVFALRPNHIQVAEAVWVLGALAQVADDYRGNSLPQYADHPSHDEAFRSEDAETDGEILRHLRNVLRLPNAAPVPGATPVELDGSALSLAYVVLLSVDERLLGAGA